MTGKLPIALANTIILGSKFRRSQPYFTVSRFSLTAKFLLVLASIVILRSEFHRTHDLILLSGGSGSLQLAASCLTTQSESELLYDWRFTVNQLVLVTSPLRLTSSNFYFQLNTCDHSPYVTSSLTRGWVCHLQSVLHSPARSFSGPSPAGLMTTFYCLRFETPLTRRATSPYLYPIGRGCPSYIPRHWVPFSLLPTTASAVHTPKPERLPVVPSVYDLLMSRIENSASKTSCTVEWRGMLAVA
jgi:hypothetical protein